MVALTRGKGACAVPRRGLIGIFRRYLLVLLGTAAALAATGVLASHCSVLPYANQCQGSNLWPVPDGWSPDNNGDCQPEAPNTLPATMIGWLAYLHQGGSGGRVGEVFSSLYAGQIWCRATYFPNATSYCYRALSPYSGYAENSVCGMSHPTNPIGCDFNLAYNCPSGYYPQNGVGPYTCIKWSIPKKPSDGICTQRSIPGGTNQQDPLDPDCAGVTECTYVDKNLGPPQVCTGNPIHVGTGNKYQAEVDYQGSGTFPLSLVRHYNSQASGPGRAGHNWNIFPSLAVISGTAVQATRPDMKGLQFSLMSGQWRPDADVTERLDRLTDGAGNTTGWTLTLADGVVETYSTSGTVTGYRHPSGQTITVLGADTAHALLIDAHGRSLALDFDARNNLASLTDPAGGVTTYTYDAAGNLINVTYPDGGYKTYHYEAPGFPHALTGISDENGHRYATWSYDDQGMAVSSEHAGGAGRVDLTYNADGSTTVTDALGSARTYGFETVLGVVKGTSISQPGGAGCGAASSAMGHDAHGNITTLDDFNSHRTRYWHDMARNLETTRVEGLAVENGSEVIKLETRTFTTDWHPTWRLPAVEKTYTGGADSSGTPLGTLVKTVTSSYDASGNLLTRTETDNVRSESRTWTYTYFSMGRIASADGPRTDVADITIYAYYPDDDADLARRGQLWKITNAMGHVTTFDDYDLHGHVTRTTDPNGLVTTLAYDPRGRLTHRTVGTRTTTYTYDPAGNLTSLSLPDGSTSTFSYDPAHRLTNIQDAQGNRIAYTLDGLGNRVAESVYDAQGNPVRSLDRQFDALGRLWKEVRGVNGQAAVTEYGYDAQGNPTVRTDPLNHTARATYDALDRLARNEDALQGHADVARDVTDSITTVTDPKGLNTAYAMDAFGQIRQETSPDRGVTAYTYDDAGNLKTRTDARGVLTTYAYDALNRLTRIHRSTGKDAIYTWDQGANALGRLAGMTDESGSTGWSYNLYGERTGKSQTHRSGLVRNLAYAFLNGQRTRIDYPSGAYAEYTWNQGHVTDISVNGVPVLSGIQYQPFGAPTAWTWGNGQTYNQGHDPQNGWMLSYPLGGDTRTLGYDAAGRIVGYTHNRPGLDQGFGYDASDRLTDFTNRQGSAAWQYDANGNRTLHRSGSTDYPYVLAANSNRLMSVAGPVAKAYQYDAAGNVTDDGAYGFVYNDFGRLEKVTRGDKTTRYRYNGLGQRLQKNGRGAANGPLHFVYDETGLLLGEYDGDGMPRQETIWLDDKPVAVLSQLRLLYVYADHLNTPRVLTDTAGEVVWRWNGDPFGVGNANRDPDKDEEKVTYNLRFSGQYYDKESGLHYNYFRDYEPRTGRYVQADPIGVEGGLNLYAYVAGNPITFIDPLGLWATDAHDYFIDTMFSSLAPAIRDIIKSGSAYADKPKFQGPDYAHMHAMSSKSMSAIESRKNMCDFIKKYMGAANDAQLAGTAHYWFYIGMALHPVMDSTSPSHEGFQMWHGTFSDLKKHGPWPTSLENIDVAKHPYHMKRTLQRMRDVMNGNFGGCGC